MILNHKTAIELLVENINEAEFNRYTLMNLHSALAENLLPNRRTKGEFASMRSTSVKASTVPSPRPSKSRTRWTRYWTKRTRSAIRSNNRSS